MSPIAPVLDLLAGRIANLSATLGERVDIAKLRITDRDGLIELAPPTDRSPNGACRMVRASDGWIAVNLARDEDRELVPAWLCSDVNGDIWDGVASEARNQSCAALIEQATLLGLPVSRVGEAIWPSLEMRVLPLGVATGDVRRHPLKVIDLTALWAGPLCGAVLAAMGARVVKIESTARPDPTRQSMPEFYGRLNASKTELPLDFSRASDRGSLRQHILDADVLITSARPRAFAGLGLAPQSVFAENPALVWVAITGHGWTGEAAQRVAFGDDAAAAGGLVRWSAEGSPQFLGDALSDPVTGLIAAADTMRALTSGGGVLIDCAMARCAAAASHVLQHAP